MWMTLLYIWLAGLIPAFILFLVTSGFETFTAVWAAAIWPILGALYCGLYVWITIKGPAKATAVSFVDDKMTVTLTTGKQFTVPVHWALHGRDATPEQLWEWQFLHDGATIHWPVLDRSVSVEYLLDQAQYVERQKSWADGTKPAG